MASQVQNFAVGDLLKKPCAQLMVTDAGGNRIQLDLSSLTVMFKMVLAAAPNTVVVNNAAASIDTATAGLVSCQFAAPDVATEGQYYAWFIVSSGGALEHFPCTGNDYQINIY